MGAVRTRKVQALTRKEEEGGSMAMAMGLAMRRCGCGGPGANSGIVPAAAEIGEAAHGGCECSRSRGFVCACDSGRVSATERLCFANRDSMLASTLIQWSRAISNRQHRPLQGGNMQRRRLAHPISPIRPTGIRNPRQRRRARGRGRRG